MIHQKRSALSSHLTERLSEGHAAFTASEVQATMDVDTEQL